MTAPTIERPRFSAPPGTCKCPCLCPNPIERKWQLCRPCAKGHGHPQPCAEYVLPDFPTLQHECRRCGWHEDDHR